MALKSMTKVNLNYLMASRKNLLDFFIADFTKSMS